MRRTLLAAASACVLAACTATSGTPTAGTSTTSAPTGAAGTSRSTVSSSTIPSSPTTAPSAASPSSDPNEDLAHRTFAAMTAAQRVGQLLMVGAPSAGLSPDTTTAIRDDDVGS